MCLTTYQPDTESNRNPNPIPNPNPTTKQHAIVNIQLNIVTCATHPDKFIREILLHRLYNFRLQPVDHELSRHAEKQAPALYAFS